MPQKEVRVGFASLFDGQRWFGNGRAFGIQRGSIEQRIHDPYLGDIPSLSLLSRNGMLAPETEVSAADREVIIRRVAAIINNGHFSRRYEYPSPTDDLAQYIKSELEKTPIALHKAGAYHNGRYRPWLDVPETVATMTLDEREDALQQTIFPVLQAIIEKVDATKGGIDFLGNLLVCSDFTIPGEFIGERMEDVEEARDIIKTWEQIYYGTADISVMLHSIYRVDQVRYQVLEFKPRLPLHETAIAKLHSLETSIPENTHHGREMHAAIHSALSGPYRHTFYQTVLHSKELARTSTDKTLDTS